MKNLTISLNEEKYKAYHDIAERNNLTDYALQAKLVNGLLETDGDIERTIKDVGLELFLSDSFKKLLKATYKDLKETKLF